MSRDEACGPHFSFARLQISIFSSQQLSRIVSTEASYSYLRQPGLPEPTESPGDCKNFVCVLSSR